MPLHAPCFNGDLHVIPRLQDLKILVNLARILRFLGPFASLVLLPQGAYTLIRARGLAKLQSCIKDQHIVQSLIIVR